MREQENENFGNVFKNGKFIRWTCILKNENHIKFILEGDIGARMRGTDGGYNALISGDDVARKL